MIKGTDRIKDFPEHFNELEIEVKSLTNNTRGIKIATWVTAVSTVVLAIAGVIAIIKQIQSTHDYRRTDTNYRAEE